VAEKKKKKKNTQQGGCQLGGEKRIKGVSYRIDRLNPLKNKRKIKLSMNSARVVNLVNINFGAKVGEGGRVQVVRWFGTNGGLRF